MPIKELQFSFRISVEALAQALATSSSGINIQVLGNEPTELEPAMEQKLLPPPSRSVIRSLVIAQMRKHPDQSFTTGSLVVFLSNYGIEPRQVHNVMHNMHKDGQIRRFAGRKWRLTKAAMNDNA